MEGNARLTGSLGVVLLLLLAAEGVTVLAIHRLLLWHYFFGFVLIPPLLLKIGSTGLRFVRYYSGASDYRRAGPPRLLLRLLGPPIVLLTLAVFATGVELWAFGIRFGAIWLTAHKVFFLLWFMVMTVHVMAYIWRSPTLALRDLTSPIDGTITRQSMVAAGIVMGVVLAVVLASVYVSPFANLGGG
ncbi:MAG TPA: hypothetical protein VMU49_05995 [Candidatus Acidoferrales bacterium]|nr:hypothetical protein [Candidatus Acidoferrales bacterium]